MHGRQRHYWPPRITDYGGLREITASLSPLVAGSASDLSFSSPYSPGGGYEGGGAFDPGGGGSAGVSASGGGAGGGSGGGSGGGGGHSLPFTGLAVGAVAAIGAGLTAAGGGLRRLVRRGSA